MNKKVILFLAAGLLALQPMAKGQEAESTKSTKQKIAYSAVQASKVCAGICTSLLSISAFGMFMYRKEISKLITSSLDIPEYLKNAGAKNAGTELGEAAGTEKLDKDAAELIASSMLSGLFAGTLPVGVSLLTCGLWAVKDGSQKLIAIWSVPKIQAQPNSETEVPAQAETGPYDTQAITSDEKPEQAEQESTGQENLSTDTAAHESTEEVAAQVEPSAQAVTGISQPQDQSTQVTQQVDSAQSAATENVSAPSEQEKVISTQQ